MGSGKTVVGAVIAERTKAQFHDLDLMVELEAGMTIPEIFATHSEPAFRALETRLLPRALQPGAVVALGGGSLIDDGNWRLVDREAYTVYLEVPFETMWQRIQARPEQAACLGALSRRGRARFSSGAGRAMSRPCIASTETERSDVVADEVIKLWSA